MGGSSSAIAGYRYYVGMHQVYALSPSGSPCTEVKQIKAGDAIAWTGSVTANTQLNINQPELFGGDAKEGGIVGKVDVEFGADSQGANSYLAGKLTDQPMPAHRGLLGLVLRSPQVSALNPYFKPWQIYAGRINGGFYPAKAAIGAETMNPAHIIWELATNPEFRIGLASSDIDLAAHTAAADTLYNEGFGLAFFWEQDEPTEDFINRICDHIGGVFTPNPATGLMTLTLARDDYTVSSLPILDVSSIIRIDSFLQALPGALTAEVQVKFEDQATGEPGSVTVHDIALMGIQGGTSKPAVLTFEGVPNADLAAKIALRELRSRALPLARGEIICNRMPWAMKVGDPFRLQYPDYGILDMVMRVAEIDFGVLTNGVITISAVQDVFKIADTDLGVPAASGWANPVSPPAACPLRLAIEAPYWVVAREILGDQDTLIAAVDPTAGLLLASGERPSNDAYAYRLWTRTGVAAYVDRAPGAFCPVANLTTGVSRTDTVFAIDSGVDLDLVEAGTLAYMDGEALKVVSVTSSTLTVKRGILDTVPAPHAADVKVYFADDFKAVDPTEWNDGQTVDAKLLTRTGLGNLAEASAPADSVVMGGRFIRPYAPGNVLVNGSAYPTALSGNITIAWAHRDRTLQTAYLVEQSETSIGPETGTTYTVRIYNAQTAGSLIRTYSGISGTTQAYTTAQATTDNGGTLPGNIRIELESVRDGYTSWQHHTIAATWS